MPAALDRIIRVCLAKDPDQRWQSARDLVLQLRWIAEGAPEAQGVKRPRRANRAWVAVTAASVLGLAALAYLHFREEAAPQELIRFTFRAQIGGPVGSEVPSVSPDGRSICFWSKDATGRELLWVRSLDSDTARPLDGTEGAGYHFWSPDGQSVVFFSDQKIKSLSKNGGPVQTLGSYSGGGLVLGGSWSSGADILLTPFNRDALYRMSTKGGPTVVTKLDDSRKENSHRWPHYLPGRRAFLFTARSAVPEENGIYVRAGPPPHTKLVNAQSNAVFTRGVGSGGYILFVRDGNLLAQPFDLGRNATTGDSVVVAEHVYWIVPSAFAAFSASANGRVLAYREARSPASQPSWFDRAGRRLSTVGPPGQYSDTRLSPDGRRVALSQPYPRVGSRDLWIVELSNGLISRLTRHPGNDFGPLSWSPDGSRIAFSSDRTGRMGVYQRSVIGDADDELVLASQEQPTAQDSSSDGRYLIFSSQAGGRNEGGLALLPLTGDRKLVPLVRTEFVESQGRIAPDGRHYAYVSDESGHFEVYVRSMPGAPLGSWRVSSAGGLEPVWRRDGRELYYVAPDKMLMAVDVSRDPFEPRAPKPLFRSCGYSFAQPLNSTYDVASDGRFLINCLVEETAAAPVTVVVNWQALLRR